MKFKFNVEIETTQPADVTVEERKQFINAQRANILNTVIPGQNGIKGVRVTGHSVRGIETDADEA